MIDTVFKRESATGILMPGLSWLTWPSGAVDRASAIGLYSMEAGVAPPEISVAPVLLFEVQSTNRIVATVYTPKVIEIGVN